MVTVKTFESKPYHGPERATVTLSNADPAVGSTAVLFDVAYQDIPVVMVVPPRGMTAGAVTATSIAKTGFTISVSDNYDPFKNKVIDVYWFAMGET
ncbi:MAG: hypothetical protein IPK26_26355 [Planctomycetes bacterium]|nr:hypothetical protein [Planctomycetota bacterium]